MKFQEIVNNTDSLRHHIGFDFSEAKGNLNLLCSETLTRYLADASDAIEIDALNTAIRRLTASIEYCEEFIEAPNKSGNFQDYKNTELLKHILEFEQFEIESKKFVIELKTTLEQALEDLNSGNAESSLKKIKLVRSACRSKSQELFTK